MLRIIGGVVLISARITSVGMISARRRFGVVFAFVYKSIVICVGNLIERG